MANVIIVIFNNVLLSLSFLALPVLLIPLAALPMRCYVTPMLYTSMLCRCTGKPCRGGEKPYLADASHGRTLQNQATANRCPSMPCQRHAKLCHYIAPHRHTMPAHCLSVPMLTKRSLAFAMRRPASRCIALAGLIRASAHPADRGNAGAPLYRSMPVLRM